MKGSLAASLTSPSPLPCCQGCAPWGQSQLLRGEEAHRRAAGWVVSPGAMRAGSAEQATEGSEPTASRGQMLFASKQGHFSGKIYHQAGRSSLSCSYEEKEATTMYRMILTGGPEVFTHMGDLRTLTAELNTRCVLDSVAMSTTKKRT